MKLNLVKMQGCGNDFLFIDLLRANEDLSLGRDQIVFLCDRNFGAGADGLVILRPGEGVHAAWTFFNADGSSAEMCGNAARCAIKHLQLTHFPGDPDIAIKTKAGIIRGRVLTDGRTEVALAARQDARVAYTEKLIKLGNIPIQAYCIDTGVPHAVVEVQDLRSYPVDDIGRQLVRHPAFGADGSNITFIQRISENQILSTTFERGVERETLACGTGAAAAAFVFGELYLQRFPIKVSVPGGELELDWSQPSNRLLLRGPAEYIMHLQLDHLPSRFSPRPLFGKRRSP